MGLFEADSGARDLLDGGPANEVEASKKAFEDLSWHIAAGTVLLEREPNSRESWE